MGLDMYLYAKINAPKDSPLAKIVEEHLTDDHRKQIESEDFGHSAYISGWNFPEGSHPRTPEPLYVALTAATGVAGDGSSPHLTLESDGAGGYNISPTLMYWRKANAIHQWFVERCQNGEDDCDQYEVHPEMLMELIEKCETVAADNSKAAEVLPTQGGFFFGGTEYDEWYFSDVKETATNLRERVALLPTGATLYYQSSW